jgi:hypothetical protein
VNFADTDELAEGVSRVTLSIEGEASIVADASMLGSNLGDESVDIDEFEIDVIAVDIDGWYVSPMLTGAHYIHGLLDDAGVDVGDAEWDRVADIEPTDKAESPTEAVEMMFEAAADLDIESFADTMAGGPARVALVFSDMLDTLLDEVGDSVDIDLDSVDVTELDDGKVGVDGLSFSVEVVDEYDGTVTSTEVEIEDDCVTVESDGDSDTRCALRNAPLETGLDSEQILLHTTKRNGAVVIDPIRSFMSLAEEVVTRVSADTLLDGLDLEVFDDASSITTGTTIDVELGGRTYLVYELVSPGDGDVAIAAESEDMYFDYFVKNDGVWDYTYSSDNVIEDSGGAEAVRIVAHSYCEDYDDEALFFTCEWADDASGRFVIGEVEESTAQVPGVISGSISPGSAVVYSFDISERIAVDWTEDSEVELSVSGPYSYEDDTMVLEPGEYTVSVSNRGFDDTDFSIEAVEVELRSDELSFDNPYVEVSVGGDQIELYLESGDSVTVEAVPFGDQDITLYISGVSGCEPRDFGVGGDSESCSFTVNTGGYFFVSVDGYLSDDIYGSASLSLYRG